MYKVFGIVLIVVGLPSKDFRPYRIPLAGCSDGKRLPFVGEAFLYLRKRKMVHDYDLLLCADSRHHYGT